MLLAAGGTLHDLRDKALLAIAYVTLCRRSELVGLMTADLQVEADGFGTIAIRRSKTDQEGAGDVAPITPDAMRHVQAWIAAGGISDGPLFHTVRKAGRLGESDGPRRCRPRVQGDGEAGRADARGNRAHLRAFDPRRCCAGRDPLWRRVAGGDAGRALENERDGRAIHAAPVGAA